MLHRPQDETWTDFDGPSWIQYDLFRKYKNRGPKTWILPSLCFELCTGLTLLSELLRATEPKQWQSISIALHAILQNKGDTQIFVWTKRNHFSHFYFSAFIVLQHRRHIDNVYLETSDKSFASAESRKLDLESLDETREDHRNPIRIFRKNKLPGSKRRTSRARLHSMNACFVNMKHFTLSFTPLLRQKWWGKTGLFPYQNHIHCNCNCSTVLYCTEFEQLNKEKLETSSYIDLIVIEYFYF